MSSYAKKPMPGVTGPLAWVGMNASALILHVIQIAIPGGLPLWMNLVGMTFSATMTFTGVTTYKTTITKRHQIRKENWEAWLKTELPRPQQPSETDYWERMDWAIGRLVESGIEPTVERAEQLVARAKTCRHVSSYRPVPVAGAESYTGVYYCDECGELLDYEWVKAKREREGRNPFNRIPRNHSHMGPRDITLSPPSISEEQIMLARQIAADSHNGDREHFLAALKAIVEAEREPSGVVRVERKRALMETIEG